MISMILGIGAISSIVAIYKWMKYTETDEYKSLVKVS